MTATTADLTRATAERTIAAITGKTIATEGMIDERKTLGSSGSCPCWNYHDRREGIHVLLKCVGPNEGNYDMPCDAGKVLESGVTGEASSPAAAKAVPASPTTLYMKHRVRADNLATIGCVYAVMRVSPEEVLAIAQHYHDRASLNPR